jgi:hypothetical protein
MDDTKGKDDADPDRPGSVTNPHRANVEADAEGDWKVTPETRENWGNEFASYAVKSRDGLTAFTHHKVHPHHAGVFPPKAPIAHVLRNLPRSWRGAASLYQVLEDVPVRGLQAGDYFVVNAVTVPRREINVYRTDATGKWEAVMACYANAMDFDAVLKDQGYEVVAYVEVEVPLQRPEGPRHTSAWPPQPTGGAVPVRKPRAPRKPVSTTKTWF